MLTINPSELILTILNFFVLLFLLKRFLYTPLITFMNARRDRIRDALDQEQEAFAIVRELERVLASRRKDRQDEAKRMIADAQAADKLRHDEAVARAKEQLAEERAAEYDAAWKKNGEERHQLEAQRERLGELLAGSLADRFSQQPQVVYVDGRSVDLEAHRKKRVLQEEKPCAETSGAVSETELKRNKEEQWQMEEQRGQLAMLLAENLLEQFSRMPLVLYKDGRAVRGGQKAGKSLREQESALVSQKPSAAALFGTVQAQNLVAVGGDVKYDAELQKNKEEQQQFEGQRDQLAAQLAEKLLCPGA